MTRMSGMSRALCLLVIGVMAASCGHAGPSMKDPTIAALLGTSSFTGRWRCRSMRYAEQHWYQRPNVDCSAEAKDGATETLVNTRTEPGGHVAVANRIWWNADSAAWVGRRDSIARALLARFPDATQCHGIPAAYAPPPQAPPPGSIREWHAWRVPGYDVEVSMIGSARNALAHHGPMYTLSLGVVQAPGWALDCATEAQMRTLPHPWRMPAHVRVVGHV